MNNLILYVMINYGFLLVYSRKLITTDLLQMKILLQNLLQIYYRTSFDTDKRVGFCSKYVVDSEAEFRSVVDLPKSTLKIWCTR